MPKIAVILNLFRRQAALKTQLERVVSQTLRPEEVWIWNNSEGNPPNISIPGVRINVVSSSSNLGVWSRFSVPLLSHCDYFCIFDDDTVPGVRWLENCLNDFTANPALLGTIGLNFHSVDYFEHSRIGWANPKEESTLVDLVGHSWFFNKEMIRAFWSIPGYGWDPTAGEDMHFAFSVQSVLGLQSRVPPHPPSDRSFWGSEPRIAWQLGTDENALSLRQDAKLRFQRAFRHYLVRGWRLLDAKIDEQIIDALETPVRTNDLKGHTVIEIRP